MQRESKQISHALNIIRTASHLLPSGNLVNQLTTYLCPVLDSTPKTCSKEMDLLTSSRRLSQRPHGLSSRISLSSSESSPLSRGDFRSLSILLPPDITPVCHYNTQAKPPSPQLNSHRCPQQENTRNIFKIHFFS